MKEDIIKKCNYSKDIMTRTIKKDNYIIEIIFCETLINSSDIEKYILKPLNRNEKNIKNIITTGNIKEVKNIDDATKELFLGSTIIIINNNEIISVETKAYLDRSIKESETEGSIIGPKDSFNENFNTNIGLIRKRIRNNNLILNTLTLGHESKTKIGILYMNNIVDKTLLNKVTKKLNSIENDIISDGSYIKEQLSKRSLFPEVNQTERPDLTSFALLEGKIAIIVDNSPTVIIVPVFFIDFFHTADDYYQKNINVSFTRLLRFMAFLIAIFLPGYYISITTHNPTSIPSNLLLKLIEQHTTVPFPAFFEILIMTIAFEILRESDIRIPTKVGSSASILGGLILGDAAVSAGIISPIMIIVVALSSIAAYVFSYSAIVYLIRYYRFIVLILGTLFGLFGMFIGFSILIANISSITSFDYPYTYPFVPFIKEDIDDSIIKIKGLNTRNPLLTKKRNR